MSAPFIAPEYPVFPPAALSYPSGKQYWDADQMLNFAREHGLNCALASTPAVPDSSATGGADLDFEPDEQHAVADMANIGYRLLEVIQQCRPGYVYSDSPTEIVSDLMNEIADLKGSTPPAASGSAPAVREVMQQAGFSPDAKSWSGGVEEMEHVIRAVCALYAGAPPSQPASVSVKDAEPNQAAVIKALLAEGLPIDSLASHLDAAEDQINRLKSTPAASKGAA
ncbi:MAG: hypothetical protein EOO23_02770 [Comamonadaceae bacterium]|nr:MAG: hypothetical protein EOO23_02770 [Comamonadaceae bacterium]